jgi:hypothetical protein
MILANSFVMMQSKSLRALFVLYYYIQYVGLCTICSLTGTSDDDEDVVK